MAPTSTRRDFESFYRDHFSSVHRFVYQFVRDAALTDELTQDAFVKALGAWGNYRGEAPKRVWILRIARNVCLDYLRSPRARSSAVGSLDSLVEEQEPAADRMTVAGSEPPLSVEESARQAQMADCVQDFVNSLAENLRTPLILHDVEGLTNREIAEVLACSVEAAKMRLHRGRLKLKQMMEENCDLFHDERNVLSCLPVATAPSAFIAPTEIGDSPV